MKNLAFGFAALAACAGFVALTVWGIVSIAATSQSTEAGQSSSSDPVELAQPLPKEIFWYRSYSRAIAEAKATGKPLFIEFRCVP